MSLCGCVDGEYGHGVEEAACGATTMMEGEERSVDGWPATDTHKHHQRCLRVQGRACAVSTCWPLPWTCCVKAAAKWHTITNKEEAQEADDRLQQSSKARSRSSCSCSQAVKSKREIEMERGIFLLKLPRLRSFFSPLRFALFFGPCFYLFLLCPSRPSIDQGWGRSAHIFRSYVH